MDLKKFLSSHPVIPAPMAGVTDFPFREILISLGVELVFTEMISSKGLVYGNSGTEDLLNLNEQGLQGIQLFGAEPDIMGQAAQIVSQKCQPDIIDINLGCPAPKVVKTGAGAALMKTPDKAAEVIEKIITQSKVPVSVKIRAGWDENNINALKISKSASKLGVAAVTVHGRTRKQFYKGTADWEIIAQIKHELDIPVIGNGDVFSPQDAQKMKQQTGCDAIMVARGMRGNPWLVKNSIKELENAEWEQPDYHTKLKMAQTHLNKAVKYYGEKRGVPKMRGHLSWYLKGLPHSNTIKDRINEITSKSKVLQEIQDYENKLDEFFN